MVDYSYHPVGCSEVPWALTSVLMALCAEVYVGGRTGWIDGSSHGHCLQSGRERWSTAACLGPGLGQFLSRRKTSLTLRLGQMCPSNAEKMKKLYSDISKKLTYSYITIYIKYAYIVYNSNMCMCVRILQIYIYSYYIYTLHTYTVMYVCVCVFLYSQGNNVFWETPSLTMFFSGQHKNYPLVFAFREYQIGRKAIFSSTHEIKTGIVRLRFLFNLYLILKLENYLDKNSSVYWIEKACVRSLGPVLCALGGVYGHLKWVGSWGSQILKDPKSLSTLLYPGLSAIFCRFHLYHDIPEHAVSRQPLPDKYCTFKEKTSWSSAKHYGKMSYL